MKPAIADPFQAASTVELRLPPNPESLASLAKQASLVLSVSMPGAKSADALAFLRSLGSALTALRLLTPLLNDLSALGALAGLRSLQLETGPRSRLDFACFDALEYLVVHWRRCFLGAAALTKLRYLGIIGASQEVWEQVSGLCQIEGLHLSCLYHERDLSPLKEWPRLRWLRLDGLRAPNLLALNDVPALHRVILNACIEYRQADVAVLKARGIEVEEIRGR
jgi:hypothetical protein